MTRKNTKKLARVLLFRESNFNQTLTETFVRRDPMNEIHAKCQIDIPKA
jgi:hypothetical protein